MKLINLFKDIIAPKKCYNCWQEGSFICQKCLKEIWFFESICYVCKAQTRKFQVHEYCQNEFVHYDKIIVLTHYKDRTIKKLIKDAKFYWKKDILEDFSLYLWQKLFENISELKDEIILIPTPMYFWKKLLRWYNQSEVLVKNLWIFFWITYNFKIIKKVKKTKAQSHLSKIERIENLAWAFVLNKKNFERYKNKTFVIVDDVVSTWSTINEIAKILKKNWVEKVYWLAIASD
jgi:ComF family protein